MQMQRIHLCAKAVVGVAGLFASVQIQGQTVDPGPYAEQTVVDMGANDIIECLATLPGSIYLDGIDGDDQKTVVDKSDPPSPFVFEPPSFGLYAFPKGQPPIPVGSRAYFNETELDLYGSASAELMPFPTPLPQEQLVLLNTDSGAPAVLLLENSWSGEDVSIDCAIYSLVEDEYYTSAVGQVAKKKALKKRVANASKRKVHKAAAKKKAAARRKKAAPKKIPAGL